MYKHDFSERVTNRKESNEMERVVRKEEPYNEKASPLMTEIQ